MTNEEALQSVLRYCSEECGRIDTCRGESKECAEAVVIKALEKQIPKKPRRAKCQLCNHYIPGVVRDGRMRFCPFCGQKIDWSVDE